MKSGLLLQLSLSAVVLMWANPEVCAQTPKIDSGSKSKSIVKVKHRRHLKSTLKSKPSDKKTKAPIVAEIKSVPEGAARLLTAIQTGKLTLTNGNRDRDQLKALSLSGAYLWPAPNHPGTSTKPSPTPTPKRPISPLFDDKLQENPLEIQPGTLADSTGRKAGAGSGNRMKRGASPSRHAPAGMRIGGNAAEESSAISYVAERPLYVSCSPAIELLKMLTAFSSHSSSAKPLELMSLLRPPYRTSRFAHAGPRNPHSCGLAADIAAYRGFRVRQSAPEECVQAFVKMMDDLPAGKYRVGTPKAPEKFAGRESFSEFVLDALSAEPIAVPQVELKTKKRKKSKNALSTKPIIEKIAKTPPPPSAILLSALRGAYDGNPVSAWPFFPAPRKEVVSSGDGNSSTRTLFANESYAPETALASGRVRAALARARRRGADVVALFPDAADHIHIDVRDH